MAKTSRNRSVHCPKSGASVPARRTLEAQMEAVRAVSAEITHELDLVVLLDLITQCLMDLVRADAGAVYLWQDGDGVLVRKTALGYSRGLGEVRRRLGEGIVGVAAERRQGILENDYVHSPHALAEAVERVGTAAALVEPLLYRGRLLGVLFAGKVHIEGSFGPDDQQVIRLLATQAAIAIENARLFGDLNDSYHRLQVIQEELVQAEKLQALGQMSQGVVFHLNNALAVVLAQVEELGAGTQDPKVQEGLALVATAAADAVETVRRLGEFGYQKRSGDRMSCDLRAVLQEALAMTRPRWKDEPERQARQIAVETHLDELPYVVGGAAELREAFTHLILNAVDAMADGGVLTLSARHEPGFGEEHRDGWVVLMVRDTGVGMPEAVRQRIFDPFFSTKILRGAGMGLSVVYAIVRRNGGTIGVTSLPGEGSTFTLRFRATALKPEAPTTLTMLLPEAGQRVLVVDDNASLLRTVAGVLRDAGLRPLEAESGEAALALLDRQPVDLVLTDLGMPGMTGWDLAEAVKGRQPSIPVVIMTGWGEQAVAEETRGRTFVERVLFKPVAKSVLLNTIATYTAAQTARL